MDFIASGVESGGLVLVFCRDGTELSSAAVVAWLVSHKAMSMESAKAHVRARREATFTEAVSAQLELWASLREGELGV